MTAPVFLVLLLVLLAQSASAEPALNRDVDTADPPPSVAPHDIKRLDSMTVRELALHHHPLALSVVPDGSGLLTRQYAVTIANQPESDGKYMNEEQMDKLAREVAERHGMRFERRLLNQNQNKASVYIMVQNESTVFGETHSHVRESLEVIEVEQQVARWRAKRGAFSDPSYAKQWHLHAVAGLNNIHCNVEAAWAMNATGAGVVIAVVDDGLQKRHPDIVSGFRADLSYDFNYGDNDPSPEQTYDNHGTSAGGAAGAQGGNNYCGAGSAPSAQLAGLRLISLATTDADEAAAISYRPDGNMIYTNSWGPIDDGKRLEAPGPLAAAAMDAVTLNGRGGLGSIYVWAGGNGASARDNCNYDGWANRRDTLTVGAVDSAGARPWYSESCAALSVVGPSSGSLLSITTTDMLELNGCRDTFSGTSAAAPIVAGVVALVLQANPRLGWRDVQGVIMTSATRMGISPTDTDWKQNGGGYWVNHKFGFGLVDAAAAVRLARTWQNLPDPVRVFQKSNNAVHAIPESSSYGAGVRINFANTIAMKIEHIEVVFSASHARRGQLRIVLESPSGLQSVLSESHSDTGAGFNRWKFGTVRHWGENSSGSWSLRVVDNTVDGISGSVTGVEVIFYGH